MSTREELEALLTPFLTLNDRITIVVALSERAKKMARKARSKKYRGDSGMATGAREALNAEAADCERTGSMLAAAWGLGWKKEGRE